MTDRLPRRFRDAFYQTIQSDVLATDLKKAAMAANLGNWTRVMTGAVVRTCESMGLRASAKGHKLELLPIRRSEYLALDVMAFAAGERRWRFPSAVMELENGTRDDQIAYSLWKVLCVRAEMRVVFCYRKIGEQAAPLLKHLRDEVIEAMGLAGRVTLEGHVLVVVGSRDESSTFPDGFFRWWELDKNTGKFERM